MRGFGRSLQNIGFLIFLLTLVYAPFAYGCTRPWTIEGLEILLASAVGPWFVGIIFEFRLPRLAWLAVLSFVFALALGWWMTLNASGIYDPDEFAFVPIENYAPDRPGSAALNCSLQVMWPLTALFGGFLVASDMAAYSSWRRSLFLVMALTGTALAIFGIVLKVGGTPFMAFFWEPNAISSTNFALYRYHANAGAYLNLVWPLTLAFAWRAWEKLDGNAFSQIFCMAWIVATGICWAALLINISKFALIVFFILLPIFIILRGRSLFQRQLSQVSWQAVLITLTLVAVMGYFGYQILSNFATEGTSINRLNRLGNGEGMADITQRLLTYTVASMMLKDADWHGFGPGTFHAEYREYAEPFNHQLTGYFYQAHQDYLQTWIEWGWLGCIFWSVLVFGGLLRGLIIYPRRENFVRSEDRLLWLGSCLALSGILLHALIDFPLQILSLSLYALTFVAILWNTPVKPRSGEED